MYKLQMMFLVHISAFWIAHILAQFVPWDNRWREFLKKLFFALNKGLLILELQVLTEIEIKLNKYFGKTTQFLVPFSFFIGSQA